MDSISDGERVEFKKMFSDGLQRHADLFIKMLIEQDEKIPYSERVNIEMALRRLEKSKVTSKHNLDELRVLLRDLE